MTSKLTLAVCAVVGRSGARVAQWWACTFRCVKTVMHAVCAVAGTAWGACHGHGTGRDCFGRAMTLTLAVCGTVNRRQEARVVGVHVSASVDRDARRMLCNRDGVRRVWWA